MLPIVLMEKGVTAKGRNASNSLFTVEIVEHVAEGQSWIGVLAQEIFESRYKWKNLYRLFSKKFKQEMELKGHAIESLTAVRFDGFVLGTYLRDEALALTQYRQFFNVPFEEIHRRLHEELSFAKEWLDDHEDELRKYEAKFGKSKRT